MNASRHLTPLGGDAIFVCDPGFEGYVSTIVQNSVDPLAKASATKFTHVTVALDAWLALEAMPAPITAAKAKGGRLATLLARVAAKRERHQAIDPERTWSGHELGYGVRTVAIPDILFEAQASGSRLCVLRQQSAPRATDVYDVFSDPFVARLGSEYSVESLLASWEAAIAKGDGVFDRAFPWLTRLKLWFARNAPDLSAPAKDIRSEVGLSPRQMQSLEQQVPNAFPEYRQTRYFCSQLVHELLLEAKLVKHGGIDQDITPTGLHQVLTDRHWQDVTLSDYDAGAIQALRSDSSAKTACQARFVTLKALHGMKRQQWVAGATSDFIEAKMSEATDFARNTTDALLKMGRKNQP